MVQAFEPITETEEARKQLRALHQTGRVSGYIQRFQELQCRLPGMNEEEAFSAFLAGLNPHLQEHVGAHVQNDLELAKAMASRMDMFHAAGPSGGQSGRKEQEAGSGQRKGSVQSLEAQETGEPSSVNAIEGKKGKDMGNKGKQKAKSPIKCYNCGGDHPLHMCEEWAEIRKKFRSLNA